MWKNLVRDLTYRCRWLWERRGRIRSIIGATTPRRKQEQAHGRYTEERARFWAALREGQREAEAHCRRRDP